LASRVDPTPGASPQPKSPSLTSTSASGVSALNTANIYLNRIRVLQGASARNNHPSSACRRSLVSETSRKNRKTSQLHCFQRRFPCIRHMQLRSSCPDLLLLNSSRDGDNFIESRLQQQVSAHNSNFSKVLSSPDSSKQPPTSSSLPHLRYGGEI
jgi:hypothetical protein